MARRGRIKRATWALSGPSSFGFVQGVIAKFIMPGPNEPSGFIMTTILGIVGAVVANFLGQSLGWYGPGQGAGLIGAVVGAIIVLFVWGMISNRRSAIWLSRDTATLTFEKMKTCHHSRER